MTNQIELDNAETAIDLTIDLIDQWVMQETVAIYFQKFSDEEIHRVRSVINTISVDARVLLNEFCPKALVTRVNVEGYRHAALLMQTGLLRIASALASRIPITKAQLENLAWMRFSADAFELIPDLPSIGITPEQFKESDHFKINISDINN